MGPPQDASVSGRPGGRVSKLGWRREQPLLASLPPHPLHRYLPLSTGISQGPSGHLWDGRGWSHAHGPGDALTPRQATYPSTSLADRLASGGALLHTLSHITCDGHHGFPRWPRGRSGHGHPLPRGERETGAPCQPRPNVAQPEVACGSLAPPLLLTPALDRDGARGRGCFLTPGPALGTDPHRLTLARAQILQSCLEAGTIRWASHVSFVT